MLLLKISVIIPVYNADKHISVALDSLACQTMKQSDFEVICIDDASSDNSLNVIESFKNKILNLRIIKRDVGSGGPMTPRNQGIEASEGEYIAFLDNDDFYGEETLERFYENAVKADADVVIGKYVGVNGRNVPQSQFTKGVNLSADILSTNLVYTLAPHKLFSKRLINQLNLRFDPKAVVGEDQLFVMTAYIYAKNIAVLSDYEYYYVVKRGEENLSLKQFPANEFYHSFTLIMEELKKNAIDFLYQKKLKIAFLNRFLKASRLRSIFFSKRFSRETKIDYFNASKTFFNNYISQEELSSINPEFQFIVVFCQKYTFDDLTHFYNNMNKITSKDVMAVNKDGIYSQQKYFDKKHSYDESLNVSFLSKDIINITNISLDKGQFVFEGLFTQTLLINHITQYTLIMRHREKKIEKRYNDYIVPNENQFSFKIDFKSLLLSKEIALGIWDVFIKASADDYSFERRIGNQRNFQPTLIKSKIEGLDGNVYSVEPYFTKPYDNLSFNIKVG